MLVSRRPSSQVTNDRTKLAIEAIIEVTKDRSKHGSQASNVDATKHLPRFYYRSEPRSQDRSKYRTEAWKHRSEVWKHRRSEHRRRIEGPKKRGVSKRASKQVSKRALSKRVRSKRALSTRGMEALTRGIETSKKRV